MKEAKTTGAFVTYTLKSGKSVSLRPKRIGDSLEAMEALGEDAPKHPITFSLHAAIEIARRRIVQIDGKSVTGKDLLDLDAVFTPEEFDEVLVIIGGGNGKNVNPTSVKFENSSGGK